MSTPTNVAKNTVTLTDTTKSSVPVYDDSRYAYDQSDMSYDGAFISEDSKGSTAIINQAKS